MSQVSGGNSKRVPRARLLLSRVLVFCSYRFEVRWVRDGSIWSGLNRSSPVPLYGTLCFLFYRPKESTGYSEGKEKNEREEVLQDRRVFLIVHAGPADPIDVHRDTSTSRPCPLLAPCAGVAYRSWRSIFVAADVMVS